MNVPAHLSGYVPLDAASSALGLSKATLYRYRTFGYLDDPSLCAKWAGRLLLHVDRMRAFLKEWYDEVSDRPTRADELAATEAYQAAARKADVPTGPGTRRNPTIAQVMKSSRSILRSLGR